MSKNNFLLVDLNEAKTKKLAETITSETSRKILNYLADKEHDTEANIGKELNVPISTVHYHLQKLQEAQLVLVKEFHYSVKGREINHYQLANKYIIIAPRKISGLREKLRGILPVGLVILGITAVIKFVDLFSSKAMSFDGAEKVMAASAPLRQATMMNVVEEASLVSEPIQVGLRSSSPDIATWFLLGALVTIIVYLLINWIKELRKKN
ncbi:MAG: helix-turn-helix domain-containing protein [Candidatus Woesearchaeota archaeon]